MPLTPTSSRFTQADADALYIADSLLDAKGDIIAASAADTAARLAVGADSLFLQAAAAQATGLQWAAATSLLTELFDETKGADAATFDTGAGGFSTAGDHLLVVTYLRTTEVASLSSAAITFNNDAGGNYDEQALRGRDTTASSADVEGAAGLTYSCPGGNCAAGVFGGGMLLVPNYAATVGEKSALMLGYFTDEVAAGGDAGMRASHWRSTAAIARMIFTAGGASNFLTGSRVSVYRIG